MTLDQIDAKLRVEALTRRRRTPTWWARVDELLDRRLELARGLRRLERARAANR
jgi:hypothetical protein